MMTKEQFIEEMKAEKEQYVAGISDYFDALIEHDFDKAIKLASSILLILKPETQAYIAEKMYELDSFEELEETYENMKDDLMKELEDTGD
jgi:ABC-type nitrate/sulfonate/bicarbonate transport system ATPase subunit